MRRLREYMQQNPTMGWVFAAVLALFAAYMLYSRVARKSETSELTDLVTIRDTETGDTWEIPRGMMEKELYMRPHPVDPSQGIVNPKTGQPNGFPIDAWKETVARVNAERGDLTESTTASPPAESPKNP